MGILEQKQESSDMPPNGFSNEDDERVPENIHVSTNFFWAMLIVLIFQWILVYYICAFYFPHVPYESNYHASWDISLIFAISGIFTMYFFINIRESDLKYIGKFRVGKRKLNYNNVIIFAFVSSVLAFFMGLFLGPDLHYFAIMFILSVILFFIGLFLVFWKIIRAINGNPWEMEIIDNGYLVCDQCEGYYKLQPDESPEDFSGQCECGGKLHYQENYLE